MTIHNNPSTEHLETIQHVLDGACHDPAKRTEAFMVICQAIDQYRDWSHPLTDGTYREPASSIAASRNQLKQLKTTLDCLDQQLENLNVGTKVLLANSMDSAAGQMRHHIAAFQSATERAQKSADVLPNKVADHHRNVLAYSIAKALRDAGCKVTKTVPDDMVSGKRHGAVYGRILISACLAAGIGTVSIRPLMMHGISLMNDDALP